MTKSEHERERRAFWDACCAAQTVELTHDKHGLYSVPLTEVAEAAAIIATAKLAERDKMFPGPSEEAKPCRSCNTCKSEHAPIHLPPCSECKDRPGVYLSNWEPKP
jgi:hypothetical protein